MIMQVSLGLPPLSESAPGNNSPSRFGSTFGIVVYYYRASSHWVQIRIDE
jgi:hypothetical protein